MKIGKALSATTAIIIAATMGGVFAMTANAAESTGNSEIEYGGFNTDTKEPVYADVFGELDVKYHADNKSGPFETKVYEYPKNLVASSSGKPFEFVYNKQSNKFFENDQDPSTSISFKKDGIHLDNKVPLKYDTKYDYNMKAKLLSGYEKPGKYVVGDKTVEVLPSKIDEALAAHYKTLTGRAGGLQTVTSSHLSKTIILRDGIEFGGANMGKDRKAVIFDVNGNMQDITKYAVNDGDTMVVKITPEIAKSVWPNGGGAIRLWAYPANPELKEEEVPRTIKISDSTATGNYALDTLKHVTPVEPKVVEDAGSKDGYHVVTQEIEGVTYKHVNNSGTITVEAVANDGYVIEKGATSKWSIPNPAVKGDVKDKKPDVSGKHSDGKEKKPDVSGKESDGKDKKHSDDAEKKPEVKDKKPDVIVKESDGEGKKPLKVNVKEAGGQNTKVSTPVERKVVKADSPQSHKVVAKDKDKKLAKTGAAAGTISVAVISLFVAGVATVAVRRKLS